MTIPVPCRLAAWRQSCQPFARRLAWDRHGIGEPRQARQIRSGAAVATFVPGCRCHVARRPRRDVQDLAGPRSRQALAPRRPRQAHCVQRSFGTHASCSMPQHCSIAALLRRKANVCHLPDRPALTCVATSCQCCQGQRHSSRQRQPPTTGGISVDVVSDVALTPVDKRASARHASRVNGVCG